tara:strand:+ start:446 stop:754 length:309 start_codon:yes stop_codon:yes gene_type:complete
MTYTELNNEKPFDWNEFLNKKEITELEWNEAKKLAKNWVTCACGNQCNIIPRHGSGCPLDEDLYVFGDTFSFHIKNQSVEYAKNSLFLIEQRSAYILNNLYK